MPIVAATPRNMGNGQVITNFNDSVGTASVTYTYPKTQEWIRVYNGGVKSIIIVVGGITQTIQPSAWWEQSVTFTSFDIRATSGNQMFEARADEIGGVTSSNGTQAQGAYYALAKEPFSGSANVTKTFPTAMDGIALINDGAAELTVTIAGVAFKVGAGQTFEMFNEPFTQVTITTTVAFKAHGLKITYLTEAGTPVTPVVVVPDIIETFDRANDLTGMGADWEQLQGAWQILNNAGGVLTASSASSGSGLRDVAARQTPWSDATVEVKLLTVQSPIGIAFRISDSLNYMMFVRTSAGFKLYRVVNSAATELGVSTAVATAVNPVLSVTFQGGSITCSVNGGDTISVSNETFNQTATKHGLLSRSFTGGLVDDFAIRKLA